MSERHLILKRSYLGCYNQGMIVPSLTASSDEETALVCIVSTSLARRLHGGVWSKRKVPYVSPHFLWPPLPFLPGWIPHARLRSIDALVIDELTGRSGQLHTLFSCGLRKQSPSRTAHHRKNKSTTQGIMHRVIPVFLRARERHAHGVYMHVKLKNYYRACCNTSHMR